jgi:hypothetical protein
VGNERQGAVGHPHLCIHDISWRARDISWSPSIIGEQKGGPTLRAGLEPGGKSTSYTEALANFLHRVGLRVNCVQAG